MSPTSGADMEVLRDLHGMEVSREHAELLQVYLPCWIHDERERTKKWNDYLSRAAESLKLEAGQASGAGQGVRLHRSDEADVLREVMLRGRTVIPDYEQQLSSLVSGGIPQHLRSTAWPLLLRTAELSAPGYYELLIRTIAGKAAGLNTSKQHQILHDWRAEGEGNSTTTHPSAATSTSPASLPLNLANLHASPFNLASNLPMLYHLFVLDTLSLLFLFDLLRIVLAVAVAVAPLFSQR
jgi:hypothetical protein